MKKPTLMIGICLWSAGLGILMSLFFPDSFLICVQAFLLIIAGILIVCSK